MTPTDRKPRKPRTLPQSMRKEEVERLLAAAPDDRYRLMLRTALMLGLRVSELVSLRVDDVDLDAALVTVRCGKGSRDRAIPMPQKLIALLRPWMQALAGHWLWPSRRGHLGRRMVQLMVQRAAQTAGLWEGRKHGVSPHKLRHTYATRQLRAGTDIVELRDLLGHASIGTTEKYLSADPERLRAAVNRCWDNEL